MDIFLEHMMKPLPFRLQSNCFELLRLQSNCFELRAPRSFMFFRLFVLLPVTWGDGELETTSTFAPSNASYDCNPFLGTRYLRIGNGNGILSGECRHNWHLHEVTLYDETGWRQIQGESGSTDTGYTGGWKPSNAVDGQTRSLFQGDHDPGLSCSCWEPWKKDQQSLIIDMAETRKVGRMVTWLYLSIFVAGVTIQITMISL